MTTLSNRETPMRQIALWLLWGFSGLVALALLALVLFAMDCAANECSEPLSSRVQHESAVGPLPTALLFMSDILSPMLTQQIRTDMTAAMKARDSLRVDTLRGALAAFTNELVAKGQKPTEELADADALTVLKRLGKQRKEAADVYAKGGRAELADKELSELKIIESYLPQMASREDIEKVARAKKEELGVADASGAGKLTGIVMKEFAGTADGNLVKEVIASLFA